MKMLTHLHDPQYILRTLSDGRPSLGAVQEPTETMMRRVTFALVLALAAGGFATSAAAAPTAPASTEPTAKPAPKPTTLQRALRACAKKKDEQAKASCQRRAQAQAKSPRKVAKRPLRPTPTPAVAPQN
jgi:hypothetical protein